MKKSLQRIRSVLVKEVIHLRRDWHTLFLMLAIPVIELFLLAYAATFTIQHLPMAVFDQSRDSQSRALIQSLVNSSFFDVTAAAQSQAEVVRLIDAGEVKAGLIIPPDLIGQVSHGEGEVLLLLDGADSFSLQSAYVAASSVIQNESIQLTLQALEANPDATGGASKENALPVTTIVETLYNPTREDLIFIVPGVAAMILQLFAIIGIAMTIIREREWGVAEQLLSTPIRPMENLLGKVIPYLGLAFFEMVIIHLIGNFWFDVPFKGSIPLYLALVVLFLCSSLSVGLFISTITTTQKQVQFITALILMLSLLITGIIFSRIPMPLWTQVIGAFLPLTHFIPIIRGIMVKGVGVGALWPNVSALFAFILVLFLLLPFVSQKRMD
jgi:ABC-2 type transport system permease protein